MLLRQRQPHCVSTTPSGQARPLTTPTKGTIQENATLSEADLLSSLSRGSQAPTNTPKPTSGPTVITSPTFTEEVIKLFIQMYMDTIKDQAQALVQAPAPPVSVEPKEQPLKAQFPNLYFGKLHLDCY